MNPLETKQMKTKSICAYPFAYLIAYTEIVNAHYGPYGMQNN